MRVLRILAIGLVALALIFLFPPYARYFASGIALIFFKNIQYDFVDHKGDHYGGSVNSLFGDATDDLTLIFYDEDNPDKSVPASAMIFHKLVWQLGREEPEAVSAPSPSS